MDTLGLVAAMTLESDALLRLIKGPQRVAIGSGQAWRFDLSGRTCLLVTSGMGVRRAREAALSLVEAYAPRALISFGIAGAVEAELRVGDVILPESVCLLEQGVPGPLTPLSTWPEAAREGAARALSGCGARLLSGTALTTAGSTVSEQRLAGLPHPILEMETAGLAQAAAERGLPLFCLRAISDGPCAPLPLDLGQVMDVDANLQPGRLLKAVLRRPGLIFQSGQILRNSRIAAGHAAAALLAALSQGLD